MPKSIVKEMADYCWSNNFITIFRNFFVKHADAFENAPEISSGEHNLKYYALFEEYLQVYEDALMTKLDKLDCSIEEFYRDVADAQHETKDPYVLTFIDCLLASTNYDSFYKVMWKEGRKVALTKAIPSSAPQPKNLSTSNASSPPSNPGHSSSSDSKISEAPATDVDHKYSSPSRAMRTDDAKGGAGCDDENAFSDSEDKRSEAKLTSPNRDLK